MSKHIFTGRTTEEAISDGLRQLGCTISDVKVHVLEEGAKGLFGLFGSKQARVQLEMDDDGDEMLSALSSLTLDSFSEREPERQEKAQAPKPAQKPRPQEQAKPQPAPQQAREKQPAAERPPRQERPAHSERQERPAPAKVHAPSADSGFRPTPVPEGQEPPMHDPATRAGCAQQFLLELTRLMQVPVKVDVQTDPEGHLFAQIVGDTLGILIGRRGETLDALQYLTSLQVNKGSEEYIRVTLDTENYRAKREDSLRRLASRMATRAYKTGRKVSLEPMNPYERRILHSSLQGHPHVTTHSEGEEPNRHIVITLKDDHRRAK